MYPHRVVFLRCFSLRRTRDFAVWPRCAISYRGRLLDPLYYSEGTKIGLTTRVVTINHDPGTTPKSHVCPLVLVVSFISSPSCARVDERLP